MILSISTNMLISVDQSYTSSGIVVLSDEGELTHAELYKSDSQQDVFQRAWNIAEYIAQLANYHKARFVSIEGLAYAKAGDATRDLAGLQYIVVGVLRFMHGYHVEIVYPTTVKKFATGKGNSKKELLVDYLPHDIHQHFKEDVGARKSTGLHDLTDAYWIGQYALEHVSKEFNSKSFTDEQLDQATEQEACRRLTEQTGYQSRINPKTFAPELLIDGEWVAIELTE